MANRHKMMRKSGGRTPYNAADSKVEKEAKERNTGGAVERAEGGKVQGRAAGGRLDKRARGGALKRARGGGADKNPFSSAHMGSKKG